MPAPPPARGTGDSLKILTRVCGRITAVDLAGELDLAEATRLLRVLPELTTTGSGVVVCDLSQLTLPVRASLLTVFPAAARRGGPWPHSSLHLAAPGRDLAKQIQRLGIPRFLPVHPTIEAAMIAADGEVAEIHHNVTLPPDSTSAGTARQAMARMWPTGPDQDARQDGLLVVDELTANAACHTRTSFTVSMALSPDRFLVGVNDDSRLEPVLRPLNTTTTGGRGMHLVAALSQQWGVRLVHHQGKTVWATLTRHRDPTTAR